MKQTALFITVTTASVVALDNGMGKVPGLGWNSDYCTNCISAADPSKLGGFQNEEYIMHIATFMNTSGMQSMGYQYINMDASWNTLDRDPVTHNWIPDPTLWPRGLNKTVDFVHSLNLGFGLYGDRGNKDCAGRPGNLGFETIDANFLAAVGADWYKSDSCSATQDPPTAFKEYGTMRDALNATGRPIWFGLCGWNTWYAPVGGSLGNSWRVGEDTGSGWAAIMSNAAGMLSLAPFGAKNNSGGGWNDMSLMLSPGMGSGDSFMTPERHRSQFSLHCIFNANILTTGNLSSQTPYVLETWMNGEAVGINQDISHQFIVLTPDEAVPSSSSPPSLSSIRESYTSAKVAECGGEPACQNWTFDTPMSSFLFNPMTQACLNVESCGTNIIYDGCSTTKGTCSGPNTYLNEQWSLQADGSLITLLPSHLCATVGSDDSVSLTPCIREDGTVLAVNQTWKYVNNTGELIQGINGNCLTAASPAPPANFTNLLITRQLQDNESWAVVALNNKAVNATILCGPLCFAAMGFVSNDTLIVRDVWLHADINTTLATSYPIVVGANGTSVFLTFRKQ